MVTRCAGTRPDGGPCGAWPMRGEPFCLWHNPLREDEAAEARRLGGQRRRRERTIAGLFDLEGLATTPALRRLLEIAAVDTLALENGIQRSRTLVAIVMAGARLLEVGDLEARLATLEAARRSGATAAVFDLEAS